VKIDAFGTFVAEHVNSVTDSLKGVTHPFAPMRIFPLRQNSVQSLLQYDSENAGITVSAAD
jgi:hypothetical protein